MTLLPHARRAVIGAAALLAVVLLYGQRVDDPGMVELVKALHLVPAIGTFS